MKSRIFSKTLIATLIIASPLSFATDVTAAISFTTVPVVSVEQFQQMDFGGGMSLGQNDTCTLVVNETATGHPAEAEGQMSTDGAANNIAGTAYETRTGDCPTDAKGTAGIYTIKGGAGVPVYITVKSGDNSAVGYEPGGAVVQYDNAEGAGGGDAWVLLAKDAESTAIKLATLGDRNNSVGQAIVGQTRIFLGGGIKALVPLLANTPHTINFDIEVRY